MIIDKLSIISLKVLATIDTQLSQAKRKPDTDIIIFGRLAIMILMRDFYQFLPIVGKLLLEKAITTDELHGKAIQNHFISVIILTQQVK